jgi:branched-chain amino acid transport system ATP-binding protein
MLEATDLMVFYENMLALNNVSIKCEDKQIVGVFGANSAGKSTLMYTVSGIMEDIRKKEEMAGGERITVLGQIRFLGRDITDLKPSKRAREGIILCPERRRIFPECSVMENLRIGAYLASPSQAKDTLEYVFNVYPALEKLKKRGNRTCAHGPAQIATPG